jgi:hypothetical protein
VNGRLGALRTALGAALCLLVSAACIALVIAGGQ